MKNSLHIFLERVNHYDKLYLEFGGKLVDDKHAKRVLPGFEEDAKIKLLQKLKDQAEIFDLRIRRRYRTQQDPWRLWYHLRYGYLAIDR